MEAANHALTVSVDFTEARQQHHRRGISPKCWAARSRQTLVSGS